MVILNSAGEILAVFRRGTTGIDFFNSQYRDEIREGYKGAIVIHNHPQGYEKFGGTLTPSDIRQMARGEWAELSSVSKDPGCGNYTVRQLQGANPKALKKSLRANRDAIEDAYVLAYEAARRKALSTGQTKEQANIIANKKGSNGYHQWWKKFLPKYGYEYTAWK